MKINICVLLIAFFWTTIPAYSFQLDDLFNTPFSEIQQDKIGKGFFQCSYPNELISYNRKHKILGYPVSEIVLRFTPEKKFKAADIIIAYAVNIETASRVHGIGDDFAKKLEAHLKKLPKESYYTFPNGAKVLIKLWTKENYRVYLFTRIADKKNKKFSLIFMRIEPTTVPEKKIVQMLQLKKTPHFHKIPAGGGKILFVPMRSQLPDSKGCWFTSVARQLNYFGSEINSLTVDFIGTWFNSRKNNVGKLLKFRRQLIKINKFSVVEDGCLQFIKNYNDAAEKAKKPTIRLLDQGKRWNDNMSIVEPDILSVRDLDFIDQKQYRFFRSVIKKNINRNIPVGWFVVLYKQGAHQRLIIGYNSLKDTLYYSDSWSPKTEIKEMPILCAYLMTKQLEIYTPL